MFNGPDFPLEDSGEFRNHIDPQISTSVVYLVSKVTCKRVVGAVK